MFYKYIAKDEGVSKRGILIANLVFLALVNFRSSAEYVSTSKPFT